MNTRRNVRLEKICWFDSFDSDSINSSNNRILRSEYSLEQFRDKIVSTITNMYSEHKKNTNK
jgi:hypothetical protein